MPRWTVALCRPLWRGNRVIKSWQPRSTSSALGPGSVRPSQTAFFRSAGSTTACAWQLSTCRWVWRWQTLIAASYVLGPPPRVGKRGRSDLAGQLAFQPNPSTEQPENGICSRPTWRASLGSAITGGEQIIHWGRPAHPYWFDRASGLPSSRSPMRLQAPLGDVVGPARRRAGLSILPPGQGRCFFFVLHLFSLFGRTNPATLRSRSSFLPFAGCPGAAPGFDRLNRPRANWRVRLIGRPGPLFRGRLGVAVCALVGAPSALFFVCFFFFCRGPAE